MKKIKIQGGKIERGNERRNNETLIKWEINLKKIGDRAKRIHLWLKLS